MNYETLMRLVHEVEKELNTIMPITQSIRYKLFKAKKTYGTAARDLPSNGWLVRINEYMTDENEIKNTIIHEILHTFPNCQCHTGEWKRRAIIVKKHLGYDITRTSHKELEASVLKPKIQLKCSKCGHIWNYYKTPKWLKYLDNCSCSSCNTKTIIKL